MFPGKVFDSSAEEQTPPASQHPRSAPQPHTVSSFVVNFLLKEISTPEPLGEEAARKGN